MAPQRIGASPDATGSKEPGMKTASVHALLIAALFCAFTARADDAWHGKPVSEWNEKDIRLILERSPWAHRVSVMLVRPEGEGKPCLGSKGPCEREDTFRAPDPMNPAPAPIKTASGRVSGEGVYELRQEYPGANEVASSAKFEGVAGIAVVRWASARTARDALARMVPPSGKRMEPEELAQLAPADAYVLYVDLRVGLADVSRVAQNGLLTEPIARHSSLVLKSTGQRIPAARVVTAPLPEFDDRKELALAAYYIFFPKQKGGRAVLPPGETEVRFECPLAPVPIHAEFKLSRMERDGSPDF
jgi:hypothetical protein